MWYLWYAMLYGHILKPKNHFVLIHINICTNIYIYMYVCSSQDPKQEDHQDKEATKELCQKKTSIKKNFTVKLTQWEPIEGEIEPWRNVRSSKKEEKRKMMNNKVWNKGGLEA